MAKRMCYFSSFWVEEKKRKTFPELRRKAGHGRLQSITLITYSENNCVICDKGVVTQSINQQCAASLKPVRSPTFEPILGVRAPRWAAWDLVLRRTPRLMSVARSRSNKNPTIHLICYTKTSRCRLFFPLSQNPIYAGTLCYCCLALHVVKEANTRVRTAPRELEHAGRLSDPPCGDNTILSNDKCTLRLHRGGRPPRPTSLSVSQHSVATRNSSLCVSLRQKKKATSRCRRSSPLAWPSVGAGRGL